MPKNKGKGGKNRRRGKNENDVLKRELIRADGDEQGRESLEFVDRGDCFQPTLKLSKCLETVA